MQRMHRQFDRRRRQGFTLVELLVAMGIFIILATITIAAFRSNSADRVGASAGSLKNAIEGARSRAISSGEPRGIRLIPDPNNGRVVHSFVYLTAPTLFEGFDLRLQFVPYNTAVDPYQGRWVIASEPIDDPPNSPFERLNDRGLMLRGTRIEIPMDSGNWYTILRRTAANRFELQHDQANATREMYHNYDEYIELPGESSSTLVRSYHAQSYDENHRQNYASLQGAGQPFEFIVHDHIISKPTPFRIKLPSTVLPGSEPTMLSRGVGIDMDGSHLPGIFNDWRPRLNNPFQNASGVDDTDLYSPLMDIMFSPRGTLQGAQQSQGILTFRIAYLEDIELDYNLQISGTQKRPVHLDDADTEFLVRANPQRDHKTVALFTETGQAIIAEIDPTDIRDGLGNMVPDEIADTPYKLVVEGRESK